MWKIKYYIKESTNNCSYVNIYCKDEVLLEKLFTNVLEKGYENIRYIAEDDDRTHMSMF